MLSVEQRQDTMLIEISSNVFILYGLKDERLPAWWVGGCMCNVSACLWVCVCVYVLKCMHACVYILYARHCGSLRTDWNAKTRAGERKHGKE